MKKFALTIITINYNNAAGLQKTMESVLAQSSKEFEYVVIDGASTDTSCQVIVDKGLVTNGISEYNGIRVTCISESDSGIYNAMNKGILMAKGEYLQFLNSGDVLTATDVTERMLFSMNSLISNELNEVSILYGNMLKPYKGKVLCDTGFSGRQPTMLDFYNGTLNHSTAYIKRSLFDTFGLYDETLRIVSDWKWYLQVIALNNIMPVYRDIDVTVFDMNGISSVNVGLEKAERRKVLEELLPTSVLADYDSWAFAIEQHTRINRYWLTRKGLWLVERLMFKLEKWR